MALEVNGARGEVALTIGDVDLVIAAEMARLAAVSTHLECKSMADLFIRLSAVEPAATMAAIAFLTVRGDHAKAIDQLKIPHFKACADAIGKALAHHFDGESGNAEAAEEKTKAA